MLSSRRASATLSLVALGCFACGSEPERAASNAGGTAGVGGALVTAGSGGSSGSGGGGGGALGCPKGPGYVTGGTPQMVTQVTARILDQAGVPAAKVPVLVCGSGACSKPGTTSEQGELCTMDKSTGICSVGMFPGLEITRPAFKYGLGIEHVKFAQPLPTTSANHAIGDITTVRLPDVALGVELLPGASATSSGVTLTLAAGTAIEVDSLVFDTPELKKFRAAEVPLAKAPPVVDKAAGFGVIVGTTPVDTKLCPPATLGVPNTAGWAAGTEVEFWIHGVAFEEEWAPYGGWGKVSDGAVSADGSRIVTNDGEGVPILGVFAIKKR